MLHARTSYIISWKYPHREVSLHRWIGTARGDMGCLLAFLCSGVLDAIGQYCQHTLCCPVDCSYLYPTPVRRRDFCLLTVVLCVHPTVRLKAWKLVAPCSNLINYASMFAFNACWTYTVFWRKVNTWRIYFRSVDDMSPELVKPDNSSVNRVNHLSSEYLLVFQTFWNGNPPTIL